MAARREDEHSRGPTDKVDDRVFTDDSEQRAASFVRQVSETAAGAYESRGSRVHCSSKDLAVHISERVSAQVVKAVAETVNKSMQACQSRLVMEVQTALMKKLGVNENEDDAATSGCRTPRPNARTKPPLGGLSSMDWSAVDAYETGRNTPRPKGKPERLATVESMPEWLQKSVKASGGVPSMRDLENCYADRLFEEQERQSFMRQQEAAKRKSKSKAKEPAASASSTASRGARNNNSGNSPSPSFVSGIANILRRGRSDTGNAYQSEAEPATVDSLGGGQFASERAGSVSERAGSVPSVRPRLIGATPPGHPPLLPSNPPLGPAPLMVSSAGVGLHARALGSSSLDYADDDGGASRPSFSSVGGASNSQHSELNGASPPARQAKDEVAVSSDLPNVIEPADDRRYSRLSTDDAPDPIDRSPSDGTLNRPTDATVATDAALVVSTEAAIGEPVGTQESNASNIWLRIKTMISESRSPVEMKTEDLRDGEGPSAYLTRQILSGRTEGASIFNEIVPPDRMNGARSPSILSGLSPDDSDIEDTANNEDCALEVEEPLKLPAWGILPWYEDVQNKVGIAEELKDETPFQTLKTLFCGRCSCRCVLRYIPLVASGAAVTFSLLQMIDVASQFQDPKISSSLMFLRLVDSIVALGSWLSCPLVWRVTKCRLVRHIDNLLTGCAQKERLILSWVKHCRHRFLVHCLLWFLCLTARLVAETYMLQDNLWPAPAVDNTMAIFLRICAFIFNSGVLMVTMHCLDYTCSVMTMMVNTFCFRCAQGSLGVCKLVEDWNNLQALLRRAAGNCGPSIIILFCTISASSVAAFLLPMQAREEEEHTLLPLGIVLPIAIVCGKVFMKTAEVSEKCDRVPSLVNAMELKDGAENRFYLVTYIFHSNAGFFVGELKLSGLMVAKLGHMIFLATFAVLSHVLQET